MPRQSSQSGTEPRSIDSLRLRNNDATWARASSDSHRSRSVLCTTNKHCACPKPTTPAQLFDILQAMIEPFHDAHTGLSAPGLKREFEGFRPGGYQLTEGNSENRFRKREMPGLLAITERAYLNGPSKKLCNGQLQYGHIGRTTGYLRILAEGGYTRHGGSAAESAALEKALDEIFSDPALQALVLDLRINFGGSDQLGLAIASRLATDEYPAFTKYARLYSKDRERWTAGQVSLLRPSPRPGFHGPVVELIGPLTISAGETFTQALMGRTPHITRIGENTQGVFSDVLDRRLPNGWSFGLPNEVFRTPGGTAFDGAGIPPDIHVPVFGEADVAAGKDPALMKALEILAAAKPLVTPKPLVTARRHNATNRGCSVRLPGEKNVESLSKRSRHAGRCAQSVSS